MGPQKENRADRTSTTAGTASDNTLNFGRPTAQEIAAAFATFTRLAFSEAAPTQTKTDSWLPSEEGFATPSYGEGVSYERRRFSYCLPGPDSNQSIRDYIHLRLGEDSPESRSLIRRLSEELGIDPEKQAPALSRGVLHYRSRGKSQTAQSEFYPNGLADILDVLNISINAVALARINGIRLGQDMGRGLISVIRKTFTMKHYKKGLAKARRCYSVVLYRQVSVALNLDLLSPSMAMAG